MKDNKANSAKDKARRRARAAAAVTRCYLWADDLDDTPALVEGGLGEEVSAPRQTRLKSEPTVKEVKPPGMWTTVGKRGKAESDFPPLKPIATVARAEQTSGLKHRKSEEPAQAPANKVAKNDKSKGKK